MFVTLILPLVIPYGNPNTLPHPVTHLRRKKDFFQWVQKINMQHQKYPNVPLYFSKDMK